LKKRGVFIAVEGIDGAGKSTQVRLLVRHLRQRGFAARATREPGGTLLGEKIRRLLLTPGAGTIAPLAELALMYAARAQHLKEVVRPALARGQIVVSDRFNGASFAYQGYGRRLGVASVRALDGVICGPTQPDLTVVLDLTPRAALTRAQRRDLNRNRKPGRFEAEGLKFQERVRAGYSMLQKQQPRRVKLVNAARPVSEVQSEIRRLVDRLLRRHKEKGRKAWGEETEKRNS